MFKLNFIDESVVWILTLVKNSGNLTLKIDLKLSSNFLKVILWWVKIKNDRIHKWLSSLIT